MKILLLLFLINSFQSNACSCGALKKMTMENLNASSVIFEGMVTSISLDSDNTTITAVFRVTKMYKGDETKTIEVQTINGGAMCGLDFVIGQKWFMNASMYEGIHWSTLCGRSLQRNKNENYFNIRDLKYYFLAKKYHRTEKRRVRQDIHFINKHFKKQ